jgi:hypothetical protein
MIYKTCYVESIDGPQNYRVHLWADDGYKTLNWSYPAFEETDKGDFIGLRGETLRKVTGWDRENTQTSLSRHETIPTILN